MEKSEASKTLYSQIQWEELLRSGVFLQHRDHQLLERAQANLSVVLDNAQDANDFAKMLIKIAENCTTNLTVQQYVFTRIEEVLGLGIDSADSDASAFGIKHAKLFTTDGKKLADSCFARALTFSDIYLQRSAALAFSCLLTVCDGNIGSLISWINGKLASTGNGVWDMALPSLCMLARSQSTRSHLSKAGIVVSVVAILKRLGVNGNSQQIYELCFILWALALSEPDLSGYLSSGAVPTLIEFLAASPSRKVTRVIVFTLKNLAITEDHRVLNEMLTAGLTRLIDNINAANAIKQMADPDAEGDFRVLQDILARNYRELTTFERLSSEINSGALRWGVLHSEKFWKENAKFMEADNFALVKALIALLNSNDLTKVCIALYDIGEFVRFYPNGRVIVSRLGGKDIIMKMMTHDDAEVQKYTLQCISKVMVTNWEHLQ